LRPGVRQHYLGWLQGARPELVPAYRDRYRTAYLPAGEQRALAERVEALVRAARSGHAASQALPQPARLGRRDQRPPPPSDDTGSQLQFGL
jgi:hypothetical protein